MSLVGFHKVLIASAIGFCAGFGGWRLLHYARGGSGSDLLLGLAFTVASVALAVYLVFLRRFLGRTGR